MPVQPLHNEKELLRLVAQSDESAFRILFDAYRNTLYFYILRITGSKEAAEDVLQETFLKIWLNRHALDKVQNFKAWLFRIAQNDVLNGLKRKAIEAEVLKDKVDQPMSERIADEQLHYKQVRIVLQKAIDALPPQQKKVFLLRREEGRKIKEIADILNISSLTVKRHLTSAQKAIKTELDSSFPETGAIILLIFGLLHQ